MPDERLTSPKVTTSCAEARAALLAARSQGNRVGLVLTLGAIHEGHLSLVRAARQKCDVTAATIFVNPTQFGPDEDFEQYPRTFDDDLAAFAKHGVDLVFAPARDELYPPGHSTYVEPPAVARPFEGKCRPHHFRGVTTIVLKLFNALPADVSFFGQKDYQQCLVVRRMVQDFNLPIEIEMCPIVREGDGLALSSRNRYLAGEERKRAVALSQALRNAESECLAGQRNASELVEQMQSHLNAAGIDHIDYVAVVDAETLEPVETIDRPAVALIAAYVAATRLIDNTLLKPD